MAAPDGRTLAIEDERQNITLVDADSGKQLTTIAGARDSIPLFFFAPDGRTLAVRRLTEPGVALYDVPSGKLRCRVANDLPVLGAGATVLVESLPLFFFSPDGQRFAVSPSWLSLVIYDTMTGKIIRDFQFDKRMFVQDVALSGDDRTVAIDHGDGEISLWEMHTGKERSTLGKKVENAPFNHATRLAALHTGGLGDTGSSRIAFSPDGRLLAHVDRERTLAVWDVMTSKVLARFEGHQAPIEAVAFGPDGRKVATASADTTALVWDVGDLAAKAGPVPAALDAKALEAAWAELHSLDAAVAYDATKQLSGFDPKQTVPFMHARLRPVSPVDAKRIEQLIDQLGSDEFKMRQRAQSRTRQDRRPGSAPQLDKALASPIPLETRKRLESLRDRLTTHTLVGERLRLVRAVEVLERIGTAEARQVLQGLADGATGALSTTQARAALKRLAKES